MAEVKAGGEGRATMMQTNPPQPEQKIETTRALHSGTMRRSWETARQLLTAWDGTLARGPSVTLKSSLLAFRSARASQPISTTSKPSL